MASNSNGKPLRFAGLIRVSTERQEKQGESLRVQKTSIIEAVKAMGGSEKDIVWYGGQEHATQGNATPEVDRLLVDCQKGLIDAVMVAHQDRWSRDNAKSKAGLDILRTRRVRFFVGTHEYDLFNTTHKFFLGMSAEIGELTAGTQNEKSIRSKIERSKRGIPTCGKRPFGRTYDKEKAKTGDPLQCWSIVTEKHDMIKDVAKRYLAGESMIELSKEYGVNNSNLTKILRDRCGDTWTETFDHPMFNIHEVVTHKIPRLLPEKTIEAIHKKAKFNRKYYRHKHSRQYLLSSFIRCSHCDYTLSGQMNHANKLLAKKSYYRHARSPHRLRPCPVSEKTFVDAKVLDRLVLRDLFKMFGNPKAIEQAIKAAIPNQGEILELRQKRNKVVAAMAKTAQAISRVQDAYESGDYTKAEFTARIAKHREHHAEQQAQLGKIDSKLAHVATEDQIHEMSAEVIEQMQAGLFPARRGKRNIPIEYNLDGEYCFDTWLGETIEKLDNPDDLDAALDAMTFEDRRALVEAVFSGTTADGKEAGVYIEWDTDDNGETRWRYHIHGLIEPKRAENVRGKRGRLVNASR